MAPSKLRKKPVRTADKTKATAQQVTQQVTIPQASSPQVAIAAAPAVHTLATAPAAVQQQHVVQLKQSLQLVQSLLGVSFGTIAFLRDFFPEKAFTKVRFHLNTFPETYEAFSAATGPPAGDRSKNSFSVTRLQKGEEPAADRMLAWLEEGVFPMLEKRYLKALQLAVFNEEGALFEAYTFSFRYREEGGIDLNIDDGSNSNQITTTDATSNVTSMMRKLLNITRSLPHLPGRNILPDICL